MYQDLHSEMLSDSAFRIDQRPDMIVFIFLCGVGMAYVTAEDLCMKVTSERSHLRFDSPGVCWGDAALTLTGKLSYPARNLSSPAGLRLEKANARCRFTNVLIWTEL